MRLPGPGAGPGSLIVSVSPQTAPRLPETPSRRRPTFLRRWRLPSRRPPNRLVAGSRSTSAATRLRHTRPSQRLARRGRNDSAGRPSSPAFAAVFPARRKVEQPSRFPRAGDSGRLRAMIDIPARPLDVGSGGAAVGREPRHIIAPSSLPVPSVSVPAEGRPPSSTSASPAWGVRRTTCQGW